MEIGILTFHSAHNYGAMLQAFALQQYIKNCLSMNVKIIDFRTLDSINSYSIFKKPKQLRGYARETLKILHYLDLKKKHSSFERFLADYICLTQRYSTYKELYEQPPILDFYITGSDQVFNPNGKEINAYYLNFGKTSTKKIAYAPSFGHKNIPSDKNALIKDLLNKFDHLSARETSGCSIIKELIGKEVPNVVDPVFLLTREQYHSISKPFKLRCKKYILVYALIGFKKQVSIALRIKEITGLPIVLIKSEVIFPIKGISKIVRAAGPREFLWLFENASYIVTDSFHGTAFSLVFRKNFFTTIAFPEKAERIFSLLRQTELTMRIVENPKDILEESLPVNYDSTNEKLEEKIQFSKEFLINSIK